MRVRWIAFALLIVAVGWIGGCDSGGGQSPKADNPNNVQLKPLPDPKSPGGDGGGAKPGPGPVAQ